MRRLLTAAAAATVAFAGLSGAAMAQPGPDNHWDNRGGQPEHEHMDDRGGPPGHDRVDDRRGPPGHDRFDDRGHGYGGHDWRRGERIDHNEWRRYNRVDWRRHHLRAPPRGYEWREVNGQYVLAAAATGLIAAIIASQ